MSLINPSNRKSSHIFFNPKQFFRFFWPNKRCVTGAVFRFGPRFQFICPPTELRLSEKFRRPLREKEMQDQLRCQSSAETPTDVYVNPASLMSRNSIRNKRMLSFKNTLQMLQLMRKDSDSFGSKLHRSSPAHIGGVVSTFLHRLGECWLHVTIRGPNLFHVRQVILGLLKQCYMNMYHIVTWSNNNIRKRWRTSCYHK